ncbi:glycosyltransferase family 39 protein [Thermocoleostomius sinensis]|uniref:Uncharacterized protein n=1 Tax=Thermocoleostomius sinensis A174 TaxID=2016057 RepID=A0A9E8ZCI0_9CYAN|nr:hypothetical protein [Thermocoleostomius sinensis]WAL60336.1 hypothetical protein OXH18_24760 [Thermocoleostomius sinensis A174]
MRSPFAHPWLHLWLLLLWTLLGLGLRLVNLTGKPLWTDEFSTIVFSLGNSFLTIPLDQLLTTEQLLQPLQPSSSASMRDVLRHLLSESNHPPLYFLLTHVWLKLFPAPNGWVSVWGARSLAAVLGALAVPASFGLGWFAFRSRLVGHLAAVLMAVSPFGIYLSQEARHYTLPLLWIIVSLGCLVTATRTIRHRDPLPMSIGLLWVVVNTLALATHYLTLLTLLAELMVMMVMGLIQSWREQGQWYPSAHWWRIVAVVAGTMAGGLVWLPFLQDVPDSQLTAWIQQDVRTGLQWLDPIAQLLAAAISMLYLLPIQAPSSPIVLVSVVLLVWVVLWTLPKLYCGLILQATNPNSRLPLMTLGGFVSSAILLFFAITYIFERDLTSALRYNFVYFPGAIVLMAASLATIWAGTKLPSEPKSVWLKHIYQGNRRTVIFIILLGLVGSLTVAWNWGYQKIHRPDVVAEAIRSYSQGDVLIAIPHQTHGQTGRLMGIAWALQHPSPTSPSSLAPTLSANPPLAGAASKSLIPHFLLARRSYDSGSMVRSLRQAFGQLPRPLDVWLINFRNTPERPVSQFLERRQCEAQTDSFSTDGYQYRLYRCPR